MALKEHKPGAAFNGVIGRTFDVSSPAWPAPLRAKDGAPNVLFIVQDDTGFGQMGCYGSPIETPNIDALAKNSLLFSNMHTTALYSPSRSCVLNHNLAAENREKLIEMIGTWYVEAGKYDVLPVDSRGQMRALDPRPQIAEARTSYTLYPDTQMVPVNAGPNVMNRTFSITSDVEIPKGGAEGVLLCAGDVQGGLSFYIQNGNLHYVYSYVGSQFFHIESNVPVPVGRHKLRFEFETPGQMDYKSGKGAPGHGEMFIDDKLVGEGDIPLTMPVMIGLAGGMVCGADTGSPVWDKYQPPFKFTGTLYSTTVDLSGETIRDPEAEMRVHLARQ